MLHYIEVSHTDTRFISTGCGGQFHGKNGNFSSQGFPSDYQANTECEWEIDTPAGYHAVISFNTQFDIETSDHCQNDYVQVCGQCVDSMRQEK